MKTKQTTLGLLVIVAGIVIFLANINFGTTRSILADWWPLALIVTGIYLLWSNARSYVWPLVLMGSGGILLLKTLKIADVDFGTLIIPLILLLVGTSIIVSALRRQRQPTISNDDSMTAILGGTTSRNVSDNYEGAMVTAIMGGVELDISRATIKNEAILSVNIIMGGLELRVADDVQIINRTQSILGGVENKTAPTTQKNNPRLVIEGLILMGGIEIKR